VYDLQRSRRGQTRPGSKEEETANAVLVPATAVSHMSESTPSGLVAEGLRLGVESNDLLKEFDQVLAPSSGASPDWPLLQYSIIKDGAVDMG
jgi:hypothetical protein